MTKESDLLEHHRRMDEEQLRPFREFHDAAFELRDALICALGIPMVVGWLAGIFKRHG